MSPTAQDFLNLVRALLATAAGALALIVSTLHGVKWPVAAAIGMLTAVGTWLLAGVILGPP
jgi:uncharacterized membrane protein YhhN